MHNSADFPIDLLAVVQLAKIYGTENIYQHMSIYL